MRAESLSDLLPLSPKRTSSRLLSALFGWPHSSVASSTIDGHDGSGSNLPSALMTAPRRATGIWSSCRHTACRRCVDRLRQAALRSRVRLTCASARHRAGGADRDNGSEPWHGPFSPAQRACTIWLGRVFRAARSKHVAAALVLAL